MFLMNTIFYSRINSKFGLHNLFVYSVEEAMGHCVGYMELQRLRTLVFISILYLNIDNYYCHNAHHMLFMYLFKISYIYNFFILVQSKTFGGPIEETVATIGKFCNFFLLIFFKIHQ